MITITAVYLPISDAGRVIGPKDVLPGTGWSIEGRQTKSKTASADDEETSVPQRSEMNVVSQIRKGAQRLTGTIAAAGAAYAVYAAAMWLRYGHSSHAVNQHRDSLLDQMMPVCDVAEQHSVDVSAPIDITFAAASRVDLLDSIVLRSIFKLRELILGGRPDERRLPHGLLAQARALGWGLLAGVPDREVVLGAVTRPWEGNVIFRTLTADEFVAFREPGYVKIAWTLAVAPVSATKSIVRTETRAITTDSSARAKFRLYWAAFSPGVVLIRKLLLRSAKNEAERLARKVAIA